MTDPGALAASSTAARNVHPLNADEQTPSPGVASWSSMVLANGLIYILNQSADCVILKASPKFEVVGINTLDFSLTNASIAPSDGELFVRTHKHLWCIGEGKRAQAEQ